MGACLVGVVGVGVWLGVWVWVVGGLWVLMVVCVAGWVVCMSVGFCGCA